MPAAQLDTGYLLSKFNIEGPSTKSKKATTLVDAQFSIPIYNRHTTTAPSNLVLATVPGEGIHLYESSQNQHLNSWVVPSDVSLSGPAKLVINSIEPSLSSLGVNGKFSKSEKRLSSLSVSETESDNGVESELSSTIDTQNFHLLERGYFLYGIISGKKKNNDSVWVWTSEGKRTEIKFNEAIFEIHPLADASLGKSFCTVVFKSGKIALYSANLEDCLCQLSSDLPIAQTFFVPSNQAEFLAGSLKEKNGQVLLLLSQNKASSFASFYFVDTVSSSFILVGQKIELGSLLSFKEASFSFWNKSGVLLALDSDSVLRKVTLSPCSSKFTEKSIQLCNLSPSKKHSPSILALSGDHAVISVTEYHDSILKQFLLLWDVQHGVVLQKLYLKDVEFNQKVTDISTHFRYHASLLPNQNSIILSTSHRFSNADNKSGFNVEIYMVPFSCSDRSALVDLIHKHTLTSPYLPLLELSHKSSGSPASISITVADGNVCELSKPGDVDNKLCSKILSCSDVEALFFSHLNSLSSDSFIPSTKKVDFPSKGLFSEITTRPELFQSSALLSHDKKLVGDNSYSSKIWAQIYNLYSFGLAVKPKQIAAVQSLSSRYISTLVSRMIKDKEGVPDLGCYSSRTMTALILGTRIFSAMFTAEHGGLLNVLISRNDWHNVQLALILVPDLAERELVTVLKSSYSKFADCDSTLNPDLSLEAYLSLVLDYNFDHQLVVYSLSLLAEREVSAYLPLLAKLLDEHSSIDRLVSQGTGTFLKIYHLFSSILDVHFTYVSTSDDLHEIVNDLKKKVRSRLDSLKSLSQFEPIITPYVPSKRASDSDDLTNSSNSKRPRNTIMSRRLDKPYQIEVFRLF